MNLLAKTFAWAFFLYGAYCIFLFFVQRTVLFPRKQIPHPPEGVTDAHTGDFEKIWLKTDDGKIEAWFLPPVNGPSEVPAPVVIFGHGNAGLIDFWPEALNNFTRMGIGLLLVEYPGYGRSSGIPTERSIRQAFVAAYDALVSRKTVDPARIVLFGRSLGGGAVCALALKRPSAALILMSTFTSVPAMASKFLVPGFLVRDPFDNLDTIKNYPAPVFIIHGRHDSIIPFSHASDLHRAAQNSTLFIDSAGHNDCPSDWNKFWKDLKLFLRSNNII